MNSKENVKVGEILISKDYIYSQEYEDLMFKFLDRDADRFDLPHKSENFLWRQKGLWYMGAWRHMSTYQFRDLISEFVFSDKKGLDFGGWNGPIHGTATVVDTWEKAKYHSLAEFGVKTQDYIFSSHCLEHIKNFEYKLDQMYEILKDDGKLILILPSYKVRKWHVGAGNTHIYNMILSFDEKIPEFEADPHYAPYYRLYYKIIDKIVEKAGFKLLKCEYCWDNSIFIYAEK